MDIQLSDADAAFRQEVRTFIQDNLDDTTRLERRDTHAIGYYSQISAWHKKLHKKGWAAPNWPEQYGGPGWTTVQQYIFTNECCELGAPLLAPFGLSMCGPVLMAFGSDAQKAEYLPGILSMQDYWCQGYSEPGSGSDLASLKTKAEDKGDHYLVNGQKIWTTHAHHANRIFLLVRTDPDVKAQRGISFLLLDMDMPGIRVRPIITLAGDHEVNEVFFDNVKVPKDRLVGKPNQGWSIAKFLLSHERSGGYSSLVKHLLNDIKYVAKQEKAGDGQALASDASFSGRLAQLEIEALSAEITERRIISEFSQGGDPGAKTSILKAMGSELLQRATHLNMEAIGYYAQADQFDARQPGSNAAPVGAAYGVAATAAYFNDRASSIYAGSNEVQRNIVAAQVLGI